MNITSLNQLDIVNGVYTYADYLLWKFEERVELLRGKIFTMTAPSPRHQEICMNIGKFLDNFFENQKCAVYLAPFDVRLPQKNEKGNVIHTVVQPDICVICDPKKIDDKGCLGAPDLVIEILSPSNSKKELKYKFDLYEEAGIQEYWVVYPNEEAIYIYVLEEGIYRAVKKPFVDSYVNSLKFPNLKIHTDSIFHKKF